MSVGVTAEQPTAVLSVSTMHEHVHQEAAAHQQVGQSPEDMGSVLRDQKFEWLVCIWAPEIYSTTSRPRSMPIWQLNGYSPGRSGMSSTGTI